MKDIKWLRKEVNDYLDIEGAEDARMALKAVLDYIDQLDKPELTDELLENAQELLLQKKVFQHEGNWYEVIQVKDEPEITLDKAFEKVAKKLSLTKEQIAKDLERLETCGWSTTYEQPELPVIPDYVAEFIKGPLKKGIPERVNSKEDMIHVIMRYGYGENLNVDTLYKKEEYKVKYNKDRELADYISFNKETVIRAILDGFTIEVKKYSVAVDHDNGDWTYASDGRNTFKTRFESDATQLAKLLGGRVIRYEKGE